MTFSEASRKVEENLHLIGTVENTHVIEDVITLPKEKDIYDIITKEYRPWRINNPNEHYKVKLTPDMVSSWRAVKVYKTPRENALLATDL